MKIGYLDKLVHPKLVRLRFIAFASLMLTSALWAYTSPNGVPVYIWAKGYSTATEGYIELSGLFESEVTLSSRVLKTATRVEGSGELKIAFDQSPLLIPGSQYEVVITGEQISQYALYAVAPPGYRVRIGGELRTCLVNTDGSPSSNVTVVVEPINKRHPDLAGLAHDTAIVGIDWHLSLGTRMSGGPVGELVLVDTGLNGTKFA